MMEHQLARLFPSQRACPAILATLVILAVSSLPLPSPASATIRPKESRATRRGDVLNTKAAHIRTSDRSVPSPHVDTFEATSVVRPHALPCSIETPSNTLYCSIARSIRDLDGNVVLYMNPGSWQTTFNGRQLFWKVAPATTARTEFQYRKQGLSGAVIRFVPPVEVATPASPTYVVIRELRFGSIGELSGPAEVVAIPSFATGFEMSVRPHDMLFGAPIRGIESATPVDATATKMVHRVRFLGDASTPALKAVLEDQATLEFSRPNPGSGDPGNSVTLASPATAPSVVEFLEIDYDVKSRKVRGQLRNLHAAVSGGVLGSPAMRMKLGGGTSLDFRHIAFDNVASKASVDASAGYLKAELGQGSLVTIAAGQGTTTHFVTEAGTGVTLRTFGLTIANDGSTSLSVNAASSLTAKVYDGTFALGERGVLRLATGEVTATITRAQWSSGKPAAVVGTIDTIDATLGKSRFVFNDETTVYTQSGRLRASSLNVNTLGPKRRSPVTGRIAVAGLVLDEGTVVGVPKALRAHLKSGSTVGILDDFEVVADKPYVRGRLLLDADYTLIEGFDASGKTALTSESGKIHLPIEIAADGTIAGTGVEFSGTLRAKADGASVAVNVELKNGSFERTPDKRNTFRGTVSGNVLAFKKDVVIPGGTKDRLTVYETPLSITVHNLAIPATTISFGEGAFALDFTASMTVTLVTPSGDEDDGYRRVVQYDCTDPDGTYDLDLKPRAYDMPGSVHVSVASGILVVEANVQPPSDLEKDHGGCLLTKIGIGILLNIICGPACVIAGEIALEDIADKIIEVKIQEVMARFKNFTIEKPIPT